MPYPTDPTYEPPSLKGDFQKSASGEGFGKKSAMPLAKPEEYPTRNGDTGNSKHK